MADAVRFTRGRKQDLIEFLRHELWRTDSERKSLEAQWRRWLTQYRAPTSKAIRRFPFEGAANNTYPLTAMTLDPILANYIQVIEAAPNLWTLSPLNERWINVSKPLQDYLQWLDRHILNMHDVNMRVLIEMLKLGTSVYKVSWRFEQHRVTAYDESLTRTRVIKSLNQPLVDHVRLDNFFIPPEALNIDPDEQGGAQWVAERIRYRPDQLRALAVAQEPFLPDFDKDIVERILQHHEIGPTEMEQHKQELDQFSVSSMQNYRPIELYEFHVRFNANQGRGEEDLIVTFHWPTGEILRAIYNPFAHGKRPYHAVRYLRGDGFYGIGVCEQAEMTQSVLTDVLNNTIDKTFLANAPMLRVSEGANILPNEPVYPTKQWFLNKDEIEPIFLSDGRGNFDYLGLMSSLMEVAKQRTGVTDLQRGDVGALPSRTPATTVQSLLQESTTRFDMSIKDLRLTGLNNVGLQVLQLLQQQVGNSVGNPGAEQYVALAAMVLGQPEGSFVEGALLLPFERIEQGIGVELTATSGTSNQELQKQSFLALTQLMTTQFAPFFTQMGMVAMQAQGTPLAQLAIQLMRGGQELATRLLEQFNIRNPEEIIPNVQALMAAQQQSQMGGAVTPLSGAGGGAGPAQGAGGGAGF
jgi:hypothetical protein